MADPLADDFAQIAANLAHLKQQRKEAQDRANAEEAAEANMQRADEPPASALVRAHNPLGFMDRDFDEEWVSIVGSL
jgi:hypothetical protein